MGEKRRKLSMNWHSALYLTLRVLIRRLVLPHCSALQGSIAFWMLQGQSYHTVWFCKDPLLSGCHIDSLTLPTLAKNQCLVLIQLSLYNTILWCIYSIFERSNHEMQGSGWLVRILCAQTSAEANTDTQQYCHTARRSASSIQSELLDYSSEYASVCQKQAYNCC